MTYNNYDFIIIGAGIIGLTLATQLISKYPQAKILVLEKEPTIGSHASSNNSGVLHSGIYYSENTLKAKLCTEGHHLLTEYCLENNLPLNQCGKVVVCAETKDLVSLETVYSRALANKVVINKIDNQQLAELEPLARSVTNQALWVPGTSVFSPKKILDHLVKKLKENNVTILCNNQIVDIDPHQSKIKTQDNYYQYGHLFNTSGVYADSIAKNFAEHNYTILPFRGIYYYLKPHANINLQRLIYPAPDINLPFLGIHITKNIDNHVSIGPSAFPAFSRENYYGIKNIKLREFLAIGKSLAKQYYTNKNNFRNFAHHEISSFFSNDNFINKAKAIMPILEKTHVSKNTKVGIRAQLVDLNKQELIMDLVVEKYNNSTHILNAVSPAFTCSFALANLIVDSL